MTSACVFGLSHMSPIASCILITTELCSCNLVVQNWHLTENLFIIISAAVVRYPTCREKSSKTEIRDFSSFGLYAIRHYRKKASQARLRG